MARERRTKGVLGACGLVGWLLLSCSGSAFTSKPTGDAGAGGATGGKNTAAMAGGQVGGSNAVAGAESNGGKLAAAGSSGASAGDAGGTSTGGGGPPQGEAGGGSGGVPEPEPRIPTEALLYWFKADAGAHVEPDGTIDRWADQSGNGFHAKQTNTAYRPKLTEKELLPHPVLAFDGSDDLLELPELTQAFDAGLSLFAVAGRGEESSCSAVIELSNGSEKDDIFLGNAGNALQFEIQADVQLAPAESWPAGQIKLLEVLHSADPVQPVAELRINGGVASSMGMQRPVAIKRSSNYIGRTLYLNCKPSFSGAIAEIIMYSRKLGTDERISVESYLMEKWQCCK